MKIKKLTSYITLFVGTTIMLFTGCQDLEIENLNEPDAERALSEASDLISLMNGAKTTMFDTEKQRANHVFDGISDQTTGTNAYYSWWAMAIEPKPRLDNTPTFPDTQIFVDFWKGYNSVIFSTNLVINQIVNNGIVILNPTTDADETQSVLASAYLLRGMAYGYIGLIFDKGYAIDENTDLSTLDPSSYVTFNEMVDAAILSLEQAKTVATSNSITYDFFGISLDSDEFTGFANSLAARYLICVARSEAELAIYDWNTILTYAQNGIIESLYVTGTSDIVSNWNDAQSWLVNAGAGHYQHTDLKVINLMDPSYPKKYPDPGDGTLVPEGTSIDDRLASDWTYDNDIGFLRESRGRYLFSTYAHIRWDHDAYNDESYVGIQTPIFMLAELELIQAEALVQTGSPGAAKTILDAGARLIRGSLSALPDSDPQTILDAIYYEYCVELYGAQQAAPYYNMRRYDRLQIGSALHLAIPGSDLEINQMEYYTFGGVAYADGIGTATGANSWY